jgi:hypothetical protein
MFNTQVIITENKMKGGIRWQISNMPLDTGGSLIDLAADSKVFNF